MSSDPRLRSSLMRATQGAVYVYGGDIKRAVIEVMLIPRRDLTIVGPSILAEDALAEIGRPVVVDPGIVLTDNQRKVLDWHRRRAF